MIKKHIWQECEQYLILVKGKTKQIKSYFYQTLEKYGDGLRDVWRETNNFMHELEKIQKEYKKHRHLVLNERRPLLGICDLCKDTPRIIGNEEKVKTENP